MVQEIVRFLKADSACLNIRPLRYSIVLDLHPDLLSQVAAYDGKKNLRLRDAILSTFHLNEVIVYPSFFVTSIIVFSTIFFSSFYCFLSGFLFCFSIFFLYYLFSLVFFRFPLCFVF